MPRNKISMADAAARITQARSGRSKDLADLLVSDAYLDGIEAKLSQAIDSMVEDGLLCKLVDFTDEWDQYKVFDYSYDNFETALGKIINELVDGPYSLRRVVGSASIKYEFRVIGVS